MLVSSSSSSPRTALGRNHKPGGRTKGKKATGEVGCSASGDVIPVDGTSRGDSSHFPPFSSAEAAPNGAPHPFPAPKLCVWLLFSWGEVGSNRFFSPSFLLLSSFPLFLPYRAGTVGVRKMVIVTVLIRGRSWLLKAGASLLETGGEIKSKAAQLLGERRGVGKELQPPQSWMLRTGPPGFKLHPHPAHLSPASNPSQTHPFEGVPPTPSSYPPYIYIPTFQREAGARVVLPRRRAHHPRYRPGERCHSGGRRSGSVRSGVTPEPRGEPRDVGGSPLGGPREAEGFRRSPSPRLLKKNNQPNKQGRNHRSETTATTRKKSPSE